MASGKVLTRSGAKTERQQNLKLWMNDFDKLAEMATAVNGNEVQQFVAFFRDRRELFDMETLKYHFPKCQDAFCVDKTGHCIQNDTLIKDSVLALSYNYFLRGHSLRFEKCQYVPGVVHRVQRFLDDSGIEYDKTMYFNLRHCNTRVTWKSINYLSTLKEIVNPAGNQPLPSLRDIILRMWRDKIPVCVRSTCISIIQELMIVDYVHSLTSMRPDFDIEIVNRLTRGAQTEH